MHKQKISRFFQIIVMSNFLHIRLMVIVLTGQKGIGFKSVFRITDSPEIHSNGFHIRFDVNSGPLGYILPHWVDSDQSNADE